MAFASAFRRILNNTSSSSSSPSTSILRSQFAFSRFYETLSSPKLFISGLSRLTTDDTLRETFSSYGHLVEARIITDRATGRSKGFAFVTYGSFEEAEEARKEMNGKFLDGWVIFVDPAKPKEPRPPPQSQTQTSENGFTVNKTIGWCG